MSNYMLIILAWLFVSCVNHRPEQTYDEMLNDVVQDFNVGTIGDDSVLKAFVQKTQTDSVARQHSNPAMKEEMMFNLISDYVIAGQVDNAQHLYDNLLEYAEQEYGKVCQLTAMTYYEKALLYKQRDLDNAIQMMQKSAVVFEVNNERKIFTKFILGGYSGEVPPLPIPNREVKLTNADGTAVFPWKRRQLPPCTDNPPKSPFDKGDLF